MMKIDTERLAMAIEQSGLSKAELERRAKCPDRYLKDVLNGKRKNIEERYVIAWASAMNVSPEYLAGETDDPTPEQLTLTPDEVELLDTYRSMNREGRRAAIGAVRGLAMLPEYAGECPVFSAQIEKSPGRAEA